jgi:(E)-4-hydroxy-3-methylbut-2-enyl-diphosphate synthase
VLALRRPTRQLKVGKVGVGSDYPISVQSMTATVTADVDATLQQIAELTATGCDIHFQPRYVFAAVDAFAASYRLGALARDTGA